jgi:glycosyltransferase involved in cell wall biosynthesis
MRIALISYEYPPDTLVGGIGTYAAQMSRLLAAAGHDVHVFAGTPHRGGTSLDGGVNLHRVETRDRSAFSRRLAPIFAAEHARNPFDVMEGPEYLAEARPSWLAAGSPPLVVKLHTPTYLLQRIDREGRPGRNPAWTRKLKRRLRPWIWRVRPGYPFRDDIEYLHAREADCRIAPSADLARLIAQDWRIPPSEIHVLPNPFLPSREFLELQRQSLARQVTFLGRIEWRKGILAFTQAMPCVLRNFPQARVAMVGWFYLSDEPGDETHTQEILLRMLENPPQEQITQLGPAAPNEIPSILARSAVVVLPSLWENFPYACLEAMSAACAIVASRNGGMREQLDHGRCGRLVDPESASSIASATLELLTNPALSATLGQRARARVLAAYSAEAILPRHLEIYELARKRASTRAGGKPLSPS